jgi:hypothetical protein
MNKITIFDKDIILKTYQNNKDKGKYWVADFLDLNRSSVSTIINKYECNRKPLDKDIELKLLELIKLYPYTGTFNKIKKILGISKHSIEQILHKTNHQELKDHFSTPKSNSYKLTDKDIQDILDGSKIGIGNDKMGLIKNIDGVCIRNIRKKFLTEEEYKEYHSIDRFYDGDYKSYYNNRGDKFLSTWEEKVADYLFENNILYHSNVRISLNGKNLCPDFYLTSSRVFIELFGMSNVNCYKKRMNEKIKFYNENKIKCLFLYEEDFLKDKKPINDFKIKINNLVNEIENCIFNTHISKIYFNKKSNKIK